MGLKINRQVNLDKLFENFAIDPDKKTKEQDEKIKKEQPEKPEK